LRISGCSKGCFDHGEYKEEIICDMEINSLFHPMPYGTMQMCQIFTLIYPYDNFWKLISFAREVIERGTP